MIGYIQSAVADADTADWVTVAAYLLAAVMAFGAAGRATQVHSARDRVFWRACGVLLVFLGINELLDLQKLLTNVVRDHAKAHGWYGIHRQVQYLFVIGLSLFAVLVGLVVLWFTRRTHWATRVALAGLIFIGLFVLLRAASFHHFDDFFGQGWPAFNLGSIQEMAGILIVAAAAALYSGERPSRRRC